MSLEDEIRSADARETAQAQHIRDAVADAARAIDKFATEFVAAARARGLSPHRMSLYEERRSGVRSFLYATFTDRGARVYRRVGELGEVWGPLLEYKSSSVPRYAVITTDARIIPLSHVSGPGLPKGVNLVALDSEHAHTSVNIAQLHESAVELLRRV